MQHSVKVASVKVSGEKRSDVERKIGKRIFQICSTKLFSKGVKYSCSVSWIDNPESMSFEALINVYYLYDSEEVEKRHCDICRETHDLFYCNRQYNCNQCEFAAYKQRAEEQKKNMQRGGRSVLMSSRNSY